MIEIKEEEFYALVAPDGNVQVSSLAPDIIMCMAFCKMLYKAGMSKSPHEMKTKGFTYQKVKLTITKYE
jgi:hypothetical protein